MNKTDNLIIRHEDEAVREASACGYRYRLLSEGDDGAAAWAHALGVALYALLTVLGVSALLAAAPRLFTALQEHRLIRVKVECLGLDSTSVKVHPDGTGALKKTDRKRSVDRVAALPPKFIWLPRMSERP